MPAHHRVLFLNLPQLIHLWAISQLLYGLHRHGYDGFIKVYSEVGKGRKFSVYIPAYKERKEKDEARKKEEVKVKKTGTLLLMKNRKQLMEKSPQNLSRFVPILKFLSLMRLR